jgi:hypothetical protein
VKTGQPPEQVARVGAVSQRELREPPIPLRPSPLNRPLETQAGKLELEKGDPQSRRIRSV